MSSNNVTFLKPHISLNVKDIEKSVAFYSKLFGQEPVKLVTGDSPVRTESEEESGTTRFGYAKFDVAEPALNFVLNEVPYTEGGGLSHLGLQVASTEDVLTIRERWIEAGLMTVEEMKVDCCFALQDKTWARDPDGNEWEAFVVLENTEPKAEACGCGEKVEHSELSSSVCCTPDQKASTIGATSAPCC